MATDTVKVTVPGGVLSYHLPTRTTAVPAEQLGDVSTCQKDALIAASSA